MRYAPFAAATVSLALLLCLGPASRQAQACCPAYPADARVAIADQEVLIAYDPDTRTEHFVRQAAFEGAAEGFGFLVPTPRRPTVAEASADVFGRLREEIRPRIEYVDDYVLEPASLFLGGPTRTDQGRAVADAAGGAPRSVEVLDRLEVAGYDVAVLEASDAGALIEWLDTNGYEARPELEAWAEPYVAAGWKVTAFKYAVGARPPGEVATAAARLTFETDRPLFPYRVPTDQIAPAGAGNTLRLYYVGPERVQGALGEAEAPWAAETKYAAPLETGAAALLTGAIPEGATRSDLWLTAFEDPTWPSGTDDLYFSPAPDAEPVIPVIERTRRQEVPVPVDLLAVLAVGGWFGARRLRRRPSQKA